MLLEAVQRLVQESGIGIVLLVHTAHDVIRQGVCRSDMGQRLARVRDWFRMPLLEKPVQVFENPAQLRDRGSHRRLRTYPGVADAVLQTVEVTPGEVELVCQGLGRCRGTQSWRASEERCP